MADPILKNRLQMRFYVGLICMLLFVFPAIAIELLNYYSISLDSERYASAISGLQNVPVNAFCSIGLLAIFIGLQLSLPMSLKVIQANASIFVFDPKFMISILIFVGIFSSYQFATGFGSIGDAIIYSNLVRSGHFIESWGGSTDFLFFKRFIFLLLLALILMPIYFKRKLSNTFLYIVIFLYLFFFCFT